MIEHRRHGSYSRSFNEIRSLIDRVGYELGGLHEKLEDVRLAERRGKGGKLYRLGIKILGGEGYGFRIFSLGRGSLRDFKKCLEGALE